MATQLSSCSSSSSVKQQILPRRFNVAKWVSNVHFQQKINVRRRFQLKSSNGYSLNDVSLQDGESLPRFFFHLLCFFIVFQFSVLFSVIGLPSRDLYTS